MKEISYEKPTNPAFKEMTGQTYGRLRVESFSHVIRKGKESNSFWNCICSCGSQVVVMGGSLRWGGGKTLSCGCLNKETHTTHGLSYHPLYKRCQLIIERCYNENKDNYHWYGKRGIDVYKPWREDIGLMVNDIESIIGLPPTDYYQIDRIDNSRGYYPDNIRWATPEVNLRNTRVSHSHSIGKKVTKTYRSWAKLLEENWDDVCIEWRTDRNPDTENGFKQFLADMGEKPEDRWYAPLVRIDETKPFQRGNVVWGYKKGRHDVVPFLY